MLEEMHHFDQVHSSLLRSSLLFSSLLNQTFFLESSTSIMLFRSFPLFVAFVEKDVFSLQAGAQNITPEEQQDILNKLANRYRRAVLPTYGAHVTIIKELLRDLRDIITTFPEDLPTRFDTGRKAHVLFLLNALLA